MRCPRSRTVPTWWAACARRNHRTAEAAVEVKVEVRVQAEVEVQEVAVVEAVTEVWVEV